MSDEQAEAVETADVDDGASAEFGGIESMDPGGDDSIEELGERIAESDPEEIARGIAALRERIDELEGEVAEVEAEREDLESRLKRKQAEFQNYKKRQEKRREEERARATEDLVEQLLEVRDNLKRALEQEDDADIRDGVEATFRQLDETLRSENVEPVEPEPGTDVDPNRHEVLLRVESDQPADTVAELHRPGYEMAEKVLRPAQVTVSDGAAGDDGDE
jgi:molecular chaperone GrpE